MISRAFINKSFASYLPLLIILAISAFMRFVKIWQFFQFDFDQQVPAEAAYDFFINHKLTLVGQELSFQGFFLGPLNNWIQFIPYKLCNLLPDCIPYFYGLISLATGPVLFIAAKKIFDSKTALIASAIYLISVASISAQWNVNSNYFLFLSSVGLLFCANQYLMGKKLYLILGAFIAGLATVNFNPVYLFSTIAFFAASLTKSPRNYLVYLLASASFLINYLPLAIFNFRHNKYQLINR